MQRVLVLLGAALPALAQYAGPAILSRGEAPSAMSVPQIHFRPSISVNGTYDSGLAGVAVDDQGQLASNAAYGVSVTWGVAGTHSWEHTKLGITYAGGLAHYPSSRRFDSINQSLLLGLTHQINRRVVANYRQTAGLVTRNFGLLGIPETATYDPASAFVPTTDFFDNRTAYLTMQGGASYQRTARLSFNAGAGTFVNLRRSQSLSGVRGLNTQGDAQYRLSRHNTVGVVYSYMHFGFDRINGTTDAHGVSGTFARQLTRRLEFSAFAGGIRVESKFVQTRPVDPAIEALLGIKSSSQIVHSIGYRPNFSGRLSFVRHNGLFYVAGGQTVTPGNGLFLTSYSTGISGGYSYTGLRRWSFGSLASYARANATGTIAGAYETTTGAVNLARRISNGLHITASYSIRAYGSPVFDGYNRTIHAARIGIGYTPGEVPMRFW